MAAGRLALGGRQVVLVDPKPALRPRRLLLATGSRTRQIWRDPLVIDLEDLSAAAALAGRQRVVVAPAAYKALIFTLTSRFARWEAAVGRVLYAWHSGPSLEVTGPGGPGAVGTARTHSVGQPATLAHRGGARPSGDPPSAVRR